jgi:hypothetical protein
MNFEVKRNNISKEFISCKFRDKRCLKSLQKIAIKLDHSNGGSFSAVSGPSLRQAGGRTLSDERMTTEKIQEGHYQETLKRIKKEKILLVPQDTTYLNYTGHRATEGLGCIATSAKQRGLIVHTAMILTEEGLALGIISQKIWTRPPESRGKKELRRELPIEDKESNKWLDLIPVIEEKIALDKHEVWLIGDRESDIYEYMIKPRHPNCHLLIRASQPRRLVKESGKSQVTLFNHVKTLPIIANKQVELSRENRTETIELSVSYDNIKILSPAGKKLKPESIQMAVVYAREKGIGDNLIEWTLLVDKPIEDAQEAMKFLEYYSQRWKIERFHYILKQGLKVERLQFDDVHTLSNAVAFYSIIAWHTQWITYIGRVNPKLQAKEVIDDLSVEILEALTKGKITNAYEVMMAIGILGGFIGGSKRYPYPGLKSIWQGIMKLESMKQGWLLAKSQPVKRYAT